MASSGLWHGPRSGIGFTKVRLRRMTLPDEDRVEREHGEE